MAVNFLLTDAREVPPGDALGRTWVGWKATATDEDLWQVNRGLWSLGDRVERQRLATLSYQGRVQVVVEITGRTYHVDGRGAAKSALSGTVLRPGDPVHDALKGFPLLSQRNPVSYFDTSAQESLSPAERVRFERREPVTMIVTWNPQKWNPDGYATHEYPREVAAVAAGGLLRSQWATGNRRSGIEPGDRIFFLRQGPPPRGVIGSGTAMSRIFTDEHWDAERADDANYVLVEWDTLLLPEDGLPHDSLVASIPQGGAWRLQSGGWVLPPSVATELERLWAEHLGQAGPLPPRGTPRQGWQMDPARRKKVEDAAQDRLMTHYRRRGWTVQDVRNGNPYDAIATKNGKTLWLEAKGTETAGTSVIVTPGEVQWARTHAGNCILGVLSDVAFLPTGDLDPTSGTFRLFRWNPDGGTLTPRHFDFTPTLDDQLG